MSELITPRVGQEIFLTNGSHARVTGLEYDTRTGQITKVCITRADGHGGQMTHWLLLKNYLKKVSAVSETALKGDTNGLR